MGQLHAPGIPPVVDLTLGVLRALLCVSASSRQLFVLLISKGLVEGIQVCR